VNKTLTILFTATFNSSFIREDLNILHSRYSVTEIISSGWWTMVRYLVALPKNEITFSWFASVYSSLLVSLTKIFRKKSVLVIGGVDVAQEKAYGYGIWNSWWKSKVVRYGITHADLVLAVDETLKHEAIRLAHYEGENIQVLPTGYDPERWKPGTEKKNFVLSVGIADTLPRFKKKGYDILFSTALQLPEVSFVVIGIDESLKLHFQVPENVQCYPSVSQDALLAYYQSAKVYCQLSRHEGLPNSLCEAMLCGCLPVGSNKFGIPRAIGDTGFVVDLDNAGDIVKAIRSALNSPSDAGMKARQRIMEKFPLQRRAELLYNAIEFLLK
jgi:glycosyltransferase involved in cell wall biosynthesis